MKSTDEQDAQMAKMLEDDAKEEARLFGLLGNLTLVKACMDDDFSYALKLKTGETIWFSGALCEDEGWIHLVGIRHELCDGIKFPFPRGLAVRISDISWVGDAPKGS